MLEEGVEHKEDMFESFSLSNQARYSHTSIIIVVVVIVIIVLFIVVFIETLVVLYEG